MKTTAVSLDIREASVSYGAHRVLDRVSLSAAGGEFIALLGASGCGKTTLLRAISGFVGLASGSVVVGRQDVTRLSPEKRNIAMVFQSYALWPHMTVAQNIGYGLKLRHVRRAEIDAAGLLAPAEPVEPQHREQFIDARIDVGAPDMAQLETITDVLRNCHMRP